MGLVVALTPPLRLLVQRADVVVLLVMLRHPWRSLGRRPGRVLAVALWRSASVLVVAGCVVA